MRRRTRIRGGLRLCAFALLLATDSSGQAAAPALSYDPAVAQDGDLVFRRGRSLRSQAVLATDGGRYSHVGVIVRIEGEPWVAHVVPDSAGSRIEPLAAFLDPAGASEAALFRLEGLDARGRAQIARQARALADAPVRFDHAFDIKDETALYCTEFALLALRAAAPDFDVPLRTLSLLGRTQAVLLPGDLALVLAPVPAFRAPRP